MCYGKYNIKCELLFQAISLTNYIIFEELQRIFTRVVSLKCLFLMRKSDIILFCKVMFYYPILLNYHVVLYS